MSTISTQDIGLKGDDEGQTPEQKKDAEKVRWWIGQLEASRKRGNDWHKFAKNCMELYEGDKSDDDGTSYNILYSNTDTMAPALYNSTPRPRVGRRFKDADPVGKMASVAVQRTLEYLIDPGVQDQTPFDRLMEQAVLEMLVVGRGVTRFKYDATFREITPADAVNPESKDEPHEPVKEVATETVLGVEVPWDRFLHGYAKKWADVPWVSYIEFMSKAEIEANFGKEIAEAVQYGNSDDPDEQDKAGDRDLQLCEVHEIWDKEHQKVLFISPNYVDGYLRAPVDDPLGIQGFFPSPEPLRAVKRISSLLPVAPYKLYQAQARELNNVTVRINKLIHALKVRGMYDQTIEGLDKVLKADDNELIPAENVAALIANGTKLEGSIWLFPVETIVGVLQQLYLQRQQVKAVIFEITGIADIMRGSSQASETLGAQEIKTQWGTLRLKKLQKAVMRYCCDSMRIMAELAVNKMAPETIKRMTGLPYPTMEEKQQAQATLQQVAQQQAMQGPADPNQPPPQPDPKLAQAAQSPAWEEILAILQDDLDRSYRIDIETNSTLDAEATEDKKDIGELLNAIAQFMSGVGPLIQEGVMPFEVAKAFLLGVVRRYRFGDEVEDALQAMQPPKPQDDGKQAETQAKMEMEKQKHQLEMEKMQMELQLKREELELRKQEMQLELQYKQAEGQQKMVGLQQKAEMDAQNHQMQLQQSQQQHTLAMQQSHMQAQQGLQHTDAKAQQGIRHGDAKFQQSQQQAKARPAAQPQGK